MGWSRPGRRRAGGDGRLDAHDVEALVIAERSDRFEKAPRPKPVRELVGQNPRISWVQDPAKVLVVAWPDAMDLRLVVEGAAGLFSLYVEGCVYPDERKQLHKKLEEIWIRIDRVAVREFARITGIVVPAVAILVMRF